MSATVLSMLKHICIPVENCSTGEEKVKKKGLGLTKKVKSRESNSSKAGENV